MSRYYLAIDLGAESGRLMLGSLELGRLSLEEVHRFPNTPLRADGSMHWDIPALFNEIKMGLHKAAALNIPIASISTDSWGLDYVLFDARGEVISPTFHYRDTRTARGVERVRGLISWPEIFSETGIQFMPINTLYQLGAESPERLGRATRLVPMADAFNFFLCGVARAEETLASTTQLYNPRTRDWSERLLRALELPRELLPPLVAPGTLLGPLNSEIAEGLGLAPMPVVATCSHDTAAAVAAIPAHGEEWAYISSGTWSLMGVELPAPLLTDACRDFNFTNEVGFGSTVRLLKNIVGLWIVQECRRAWVEKGTELNYPCLMQMASEAPAFVSLIDPDDARFVQPGSMPDKVAAFCRETSQPVPLTPGEVIRCALESLALLYRSTFLRLEELVGRQLKAVHVVGGGSQNTLLNQFTANALGAPVIAGPIEATGLGNILVQAIALGDVASLAAGREIISASFPTQTYAPADAAAWVAASKRFERLRNR